MSEYTRSDLKAALDRLPLERGDVVFCHSNIGMFGRCEGVTSRTVLCEAFFDAIMARLGDNGTLCVPAFTYSFPRGKTFDAYAPAPGMGAFSECVRVHDDALRSLDPCYSVAAVGAKALLLTRSQPENSFDETVSFFAKLSREGGKILNLNFDAGSTFVHYVERIADVPYRFDKGFRGVYRAAGTPPCGSIKRSTIYVRYLDDALEADFVAFDALARERGMFKTASLGRGQTGVISAADTARLILDTLPKRPWFLTKAEAMGVEPDPAKFSALR